MKLNAQHDLNGSVIKRIKKIQYQTNRICSTINNIVPTLCFIRLSTNNIFNHLHNILYNRQMKISTVFGLTFLRIYAKLVHKLTIELCNEERKSQRQ